MVASSLLSVDRVCVRPTVEAGDAVLPDARNLLNRALISACDMVVEVSRSLCDVPRALWDQDKRIPHSLTLSLSPITTQLQSKDVIAIISISLICFQQGNARKKAVPRCNESSATMMK